MAGYYSYSRDLDSLGNKHHGPILPVNLMWRLLILVHHHSYTKESWGNRCWIDNIVGTMIGRNFRFDLCLFSHGAWERVGYLFSFLVCVAAAAIMDRLDVVDQGTLTWWRAERQLGKGG